MSDFPDIKIEDPLLKDDAAREHARKLFAGMCDFVWGAENVDGLPPAELPEVAFAGRSNVGKSSLINSLTGRTTLVRTSKSPGHTKQLNFFNLADRLMLVDMPGYGYAKASKSRIANWDVLIKSYLRGRRTLMKVCLLIDGRHGFKETDMAVMKLLSDSAVPVQIALTKMDEVKPSQHQAHIDAAEEVMKKYPAIFPRLIATSAEKKMGIEDLRTVLGAVSE